MKKEILNNKLYNMLKDILDLRENCVSFNLIVGLGSEPIVGQTYYLQKNNTFELETSTNELKKTEGQYTLKIEGFKNKRQVEEFIHWYEGQGEQNAADWFDARMTEGELDVDFMPVHIQETYPIQFNGNEGKMVLKISTSE